MLVATHTAGRWGPQVVHQSSFYHAPLACQRGSEWSQTEPALHPLTGDAQRQAGACRGEAACNSAESFRWRGSG